MSGRQGKIAASFVTSFGVVFWIYFTDDMKWWKGNATSDLKGLRMQAFDSVASGWLWHLSALKSSLRSQLRKTCAVKLLRVKGDVVMGICRLEPHSIFIKSLWFEIQQKLSSERSETSLSTSARECAASLLSSSFCEAFQVGIFSIANTQSKQADGACFPIRCYVAWPRTAKRTKNHKQLSVLFWAGARFRTIWYRLSSIAWWVNGLCTSLVFMLLLSVSSPHRKSD